MSDTKVIVDKLWNYCNILRDDGLSYGDYLEQLTYLLFLKMADEQHQLGLERIVPEGYDWPSLLDLKGEALEAHYIAILNHLGGTEDLLGVVFRKAQNRIQDPAKLERLIKDLIGGESWMTLRRREGRRLRGAAGAQRRGHQVGGRAVLHAAG
ncbi:MAG: type I restriction-modification system subunit M N-terminal domain-containing protein, partial [Acidimicrobiales bacterium]|nr:type I restriction-modification system subunit M N-terminal domain-containing protein [Acidimicrobiales bacterium]